MHALARAVRDPPRFQFKRKKEEKERVDLPLLPATTLAFFCVLAPFTPSRLSLYLYLYLSVYLSLTHPAPPHPLRSLFSGSVRTHACLFVRDRFVLSPVYSLYHAGAHSVSPPRVSRLASRVSCRLSAAPTRALKGGGDDDALSVSPSLSLSPSLCFRFRPRWRATLSQYCTTLYIFAIYEIIYVLNTINYFE